MNKKRYEKLLEVAEQKGKQLLIEEYTLNIKPEQIEIPNKEIIIESVDGTKVYKARAIIRNVPVSKFTENLNGRIYPKKLDERIIKEGLAEGTLSLADHPEDDGSITRISGVWHNPTMDENFSYGDWYLVGEYGQLIKETIEAGGKVGISRVGFGEFEEDGKTVKWDTYDCERWGDAVLTPSQQVFATIENIDESIQKEEKDTDKFKEQITNKKQEETSEISNDNIIAENKKEVKNMNYTTEQYTARNHIKALISEAKKLSPKEGIDSLQDIEIDPAFTDLQEKIEKEILNLYGMLEEQKNSAESTVEDLTKERDEYKEKYNKAKSIIEKIGISEDVDVEELKETVQDLNTKIKENEEAMKAIFESEDVVALEMESLEDVVALAEDTIKRDEDMQAMEEDREAMLADISIFQEDREAMLDDIAQFKALVQEMEEAIAEREEKLIELGYEFTEEDEKEDEEKKEEEGDEKEEKKEAKAKKEEEGDDEEEAEEAEEGDEKEENKESYQFSFNDGSKFEETVKKTNKIASNNDVLEMVNFQVKKNPSLKDIKEELQKCQSISDVIERIELFENKNDDKAIKYTSESSKRRPSFLGNHRW